MPPDETEFFHTDRAHDEYLRQQREAAEDAAARERSARSGCGLLWLLPALLTLAGLVTAWQVVRLARGVPLQEVAEVRTPALVVLALVGAASALRALALHRQLPSAGPVSGGW